MPWYTTKKFIPFLEINIICKYLAGISNLKRENSHNSLDRSYGCYLFGEDEVGARQGYMYECLNSTKRS